MFRRKRRNVSSLRSHFDTGAMSTSRRLPDEVLSTIFEKDISLEILRAPMDRGGRKSKKTIERMCLRAREAHEKHRMGSSWKDILNLSERVVKSLTEMDRRSFIRAAADDPVYSSVR